MSRRYFGKVDYDDSNKYIKKEIHYNGDTIIYVNVTDIRKNVVCDKCGKQMEPRGKGSRVYCDIKDGSENDWKILYVSYEYTREYKCKNCGAITKNKIDASGNLEFSPKLKEKIAQEFLEDYGLTTMGNREKTDRLAIWKVKRNTLIEKCTIRANDGKPIVRLLTKSRIDSILEYYRQQIEKTIISHQFYDSILFYPFVYNKKDRGLVLSCQSLSDSSVAGEDPNLHGVCNIYSDIELSTFLKPYFNNCHNYKIEKIITSPRIPNPRKSMKETDAYDRSLSREFICDEFENIEDKNVLKREQKNIVKQIGKDIRDIISMSPGFGMPGKYKMFETQMDKLFEKIKTSEAAEFYQDLRKLYQKNKYEWYRAVSLDETFGVSDLIEELRDLIKRSIGYKIEFKHLLTKILWEMLKIFKNIRQYDWEMGTMTNPSSYAISFSCGSASAVMLRPICDEYLIMPMVWEQNKYFLIVGYGDGTYCRYDTVRGTPRALISYFNKQTMWEHNEIKQVYCPFDTNVVYALKPILYQSTLLVDGKDLVGSFAGKGISMIEIYTVVSAAIYVFDSDLDSISERYPTWVSRPPWLAEPRPNPLELAETGFCSEEELRQLEDIYARVSVAPELLWNLYSPDKKLAKYPEAQQLQKLSQVSESWRGFRRKAMEAKLKQCIETADELAGHRILMGYADVEIDLQMLLDYLNGEVEQDKFLP